MVIASTGSVREAPSAGGWVIVQGRGILPASCKDRPCASGGPRGGLFSSLPLPRPFPHRSASMADTALMEKLVSLCKRRGFVFQSSEIYGGLGSVWDYGPLGVALKRNIKDRWWNSMVHARDDIEGLD